MFKENYKFTHMPAYRRNITKWQGLQDSLFKQATPRGSGALPVMKYGKNELNTGAKLSDGQALASYNYQQLLIWSLLREKEHGFEENQENPKAFYKRWYHTGNIAEGKKLFSNERTNLFIEKVLNKYFKGPTAEYLYAWQLRHNIMESNYVNIDVLFDHFKQKFI